MFFALAATLLGVSSLNAQERISLQEVEFNVYTGWGLDASKGEAIEPAWNMGVEVDPAYGDGSVNNGADLSGYSKLYVTVDPSVEAPRIMINRMIEEGQCAATKEESNLISIPSHAWCTDLYCTKDGDTYIIDLKKIRKDYGFVRLHAIKGARYGVAPLVISAEVEGAGKVQQVGWTEITANGNLEGEDVSCFVSKEAPAPDPVPSVITDGVGVDGSRGIQVNSAAGATNDWDSQFWILVPETMPAGTQFRVSFDYRSSVDVNVPTQAHSTPGNYIHWDAIGTVAFTSEWTTFSYEGTVSADMAGADNLFQSIAFNLSIDKENDVEFYFDNIKLEVYKYGTAAEFNSDAIQLDFGFETNIPALVNATGRPRLVFPNECATVTVNGAPVNIFSVEAFKDGRFYIFLEEAVNDDDEVLVTFTNPTDAAYHLTYQSGPGGDVKDWEGIADCNVDLLYENEDAYPYSYVTPVVMAADPESGSFNLPNSISEFKVTFDKPTDAAALEATLNGAALTVAPAEGFAEEFVLSRAGGDLADGAYEIHITKIYPEFRLSDDQFGDTIYTVSVGKVNLDPNDQPYDVLAETAFAETAAGGIPVGFTVDFNGEIRTAENSYGSGPRMFDFADGGDFTKGLYFREGRVEYGSTEGYALALEAGKSYNIHFTTAMWKSNGSHTKFVIENADGEEEYSQLISNKPDVNGSQGVVNGATQVDLKFAPKTTGNYILKWYSSNANGDAGNVYSEVLLANVKVKYMPNAAGVEETQLLLTALENARSTRDANVDAKYEGAAYDALVATITKYEGEYESYTAPSAYKAAAAALDEASKVMKDHRSLCDAYYPLPEQAQQIVDNNAENKFANTDLYIALKEVVGKYVTKRIETQLDETTGEEIQVEVLEIKKIIDDAELQAAIDELQANVNNAGKLFTEGVSKVADTGVKVLTERLRLGAEALKSLGVPEDDPLIVAVNNSLYDNDDLAESIKLRLKAEIFGQLKNADNTLFEGVMDETTLETVTPTYDMTVFVKNPNIYKQEEGNTNFTETNVPGWITPEGYNRPGLSQGWGDPGFASVDCMFQTWMSAYSVEQTITDLPAGVYTIKAGFGERNGEENLEGSFFYVKTSETPEGEYADSVSAPVIGQTFPYANLQVDNIVVTDGTLTIGVQAGSSASTFFNDVVVLMTGAVAGYDYAADYEVVANGVVLEEAVPAQVVGIELYDLNGRRVNKAAKGLYIVRKIMDNGTIRTEKILK